MLSIFPFLRSGSFVTTRSCQHWRRENRKRLKPCHQASLIRKLLSLSVQFKFVILIYLLLSGLPILEVVLSIPLRTFRFRFSRPCFPSQLVWTWNSTGKEEVKYFYACSCNLGTFVFFLLFYEFATFCARVVLSSAFYLICDQAFLLLTVGLKRPDRYLLLNKKTAENWRFLSADNWRVVKLRVDKQSR